MIVAKKIVVREAVLADDDALTKLAWQLGHQAEVGQIRNRLLDLLQRDDHRVFVAEVDGIIAGWVHAFLYRPLHKDTVVEVAGLVVDEGYRKLGIGRRLLDATEEWAKTQGCCRITLASNIARKEAHQFYQAIGYALHKTQYTFNKELKEGE